VCTFLCTLGGGTGVKVEADFRPVAYLPREPADGGRSVDPRDGLPKQAPYRGCATEHDAANPETVRELSESEPQLGPERR
jgi:hypothetical protein